MTEVLDALLITKFNGSDAYMLIEHAYECSILSFSFLKYKNGKMHKINRKPNKEFVLK